MKYTFTIILLFGFNFSVFAQASYTAPTAACPNSNIQLTNTSINAATNCWSFDSLHINGTKASVNLGQLNSVLTTVTTGTLVEDGGNYYLFITNTFTNDLVRCNLGTNPLNTVPLSTTVISGVLPGTGYHEAIQFIKESGTWYAIVDDGNPSSAFLSILNFGSSITNTNPVSTSLSVPTLGNWPHQIDIFLDGTNYIGFVSCRANGDIQRLDFGTSITNTPTITTVYTSYSPGVNFAMLEENGNWYMMVSTNTVPGDLRLLSFGTNILNNSPVVTNLGNVGNLLDAPRAIKLFKSCNQVFGLMSSQKSTSGTLPGHIIQLDFQSGITSPITATNLGNYGGVEDYWNMTSNTFWANGAFHFFSFNPVDNDITRMDITPTGNTLPLSFVQNPTVQYSANGSHNIQLLTNFGNINQSSFCSSIQIGTSSISHQSFSICTGDSVVLQLNPSATDITWSPSTNLSCSNCTAPYAYPTNNTIYVANDSINGCFSIDTFLVNVNHQSVSSIAALICANQSYSFNGQQLNASGTYYDTLTNFVGCDSIITLNLTVKPISTYTYNQTICSNQSYTFNGQQLNTSGTYYDTLTNYVSCDSIITLHLTISNATSSIFNAVICQGQTYTLPGGVLVAASGTYYDTLLNHNGCDSIINYVVAVQPIIPVELGNDTTLCSKIGLTVSPLIDLPPSGVLQWNNGATEPSITATTSGIYILTATYPPCPSQSDTIVLTAKNCECRILMPNAFTPNTDNNNDVIIPIFDCHPAPEEYYFAIYNRWGEKVFSTDKTDEGWDGIYKNKDQELDVYVYMIRYKSIFDDKTVILKGDITLIR